MTDPLCLLAEDQIADACLGVPFQEPRAQDGGHGCLATPRARISLDDFTPRACVVAEILLFGRVLCAFAL